MTLYPQRQSFQALQENKGVDGGKGCAHVAKQDGTNFSDKGSRSNRFGEAQAVVAWVWFGEGWEFAGSLPVKLTAVNDDAADGICDPR